MTFAAVNYQYILFSIFKSDFGVCSNIYFVMFDVFFTYKH